jgi:hypothetical protein
MGGQWTDEGERRAFGYVVKIGEDAEGKSNIRAGPA